MNHNYSNLNAISNAERILIREQRREERDRKARRKKRTVRIIKKVVGDILMYIGLSAFWVAVFTYFFCCIKP